MSTDLTGRAEGYRGIAIRCPGCAESMRQLALAKAESEVDVCDACGGVWIDWFDGEVRAIAAETQSVRDADAPGRASAPPPAEAERPSRNEAAAIGACPRCTRQLVPERYEIKAEVASARMEGRTSVVPAKTGAELLRCEDCMGSFVNRTSAEILSFLATSDDPPESRAAATLKPLPWERFVALVRSIFGLEAGTKP